MLLSCVNKMNSVKDCSEKIHIKEQQIAIIRMIMKNLCHHELSESGRAYLDRLILFLTTEIEELKKNHGPA